MNTGWTELKLSWELHSRPPENLPEKDRQQLQLTAVKQQAMEGLILGSEEAMCAIVPPGAVEERLATIRTRYESDAEMQADLARLGMNEEMLGSALTRDLVIENVLERIESRMPPVSTTDAEIYYHLHPRRFLRPETRQLRHILITHGNDAEARAAYALLAQLRPTLDSEADFAAAALRHSHCPTALDGGKLGQIRRGQLYRELDRAGFELAAGALSHVIASEVGWHLLRCDAIAPARLVPFAECRQAIVDRLSAERRKSNLRQWLDGLKKAA